MIGSLPPPPPDGRLKRHREKLTGQTLPSRRVESAPGSGLRFHASDDDVPVRRSPALVEPVKEHKLIRTFLYISQGLDPTPTPIKKKKRTNTKDIYRLLGWTRFGLERAPNVEGKTVDRVEISACVCFGLSRQLKLQSLNKTSRQVLLCPPKKKKEVSGMRVSSVVKTVCGLKRNMR